jgi:predicted ATPase
LHEEGDAMLENGQHLLDPQLLSMPFKIKTRWVAVTGTSCCGKTTLIEMLANCGFKTVPEIARKYFECEMAKGRSIYEIRGDMAQLEKAIMHLQLKAENALNPADVVFLDRALPDLITFYRYAGLDPNSMLAACFAHQYAAVLVPDPFHVERDGIRIEDEVLREFLDTWLPHDYGALGYSVIRIPVMSPQERLEFVLDKLKEQELIL